MSDDPWDPRNPANVRLGCYVWLVVVGVIVAVAVATYFDVR